MSIVITEILINAVGVLTILFTCLVSSYGLERYHRTLWVSGLDFHLVLVLKITNTYMHTAGWVSGTLWSALWATRPWRWLRTQSSSGSLSVVFSFFGASTSEWYIWKEYSSSFYGFAVVVSLCSGIAKLCRPIAKDWIVKPQVRTKGGRCWFAVILFVWLWCHVRCPQDDLKVHVLLAFWCVTICVDVYQSLRQVRRKPGQITSAPQLLGRVKI